jgi:ribosomal protein S18 acetylase RimI-like enzyme
MSNLYAEYLKEKSDIEYLQFEDKAFCTYIEQVECLYLIDIYVKPEYRKSKVASKLADVVVEIARAKGKKFILGAVEKDSKAEATNQKVLESYGFRFSHYVENDMINYFVKDI